MSGRDGRKVCAQIKSDEQAKHIPVIIVSANRDIEEITRESGADACLPKPFEMEELLDLVAQYI
jgi:CheY-like chemotaxis protein